MSGLGLSIRGIEALKTGCCLLTYAFIAAPNPERSTIELEAS